MNYNTLDRKIVTAWRIARSIRLVMVLIIFGLPTLILSGKNFFLPYANYVYLFEGLIVIYLFVALMLYPMIEYRQWGYIIADDRVEIRHGIFFVETTIVPVVRIQHISMAQGPILRKLGLSSVDINTASGVFTITGLASGEARAIAENLKMKLDTRLEAQGEVSTPQGEVSTVQGEVSTAQGGVSMAQGGG